MTDDQLDICCFTFAGFVIFCCLSKHKWNELYRRINNVLHFYRGKIEVWENGMRFIFNITPSTSIYYFVIVHNIYTVLSAKCIKVKRFIMYNRFYFLHTAKWFIFMCNNALYFTWPSFVRYCKCGMEKVYYSFSYLKLYHKHEALQHCARLFSNEWEIGLNEGATLKQL